MSMDPAQRIAKWNARFDTTRIKGDLDAMRDRMYTNVQSVFPMITAMELQVKQVLDMSGVSMALYAQYLCFGRELWSLERRGVSGDTLAEEAAVLIAKWVGRGLTQAVLETIRTQVFNVAAPTP